MSHHEPLYSVPGGYAVMGFCQFGCIYPNNQPQIYRFKGPFSRMSILIGKRETFQGIREYILSNRQVSLKTIQRLAGKCYLSYWRSQEQSCTHRT